MTIDPDTQLVVLVSGLTDDSPRVVIELGVMQLDNPAEVFTVLVWAAGLN